MTDIHPFKCALGAGLLLVCLRSTYAQPASTPALGEITVTATLRSTANIDVPASVSVLGQRTLAEGGVQHFQDVLGLVPNLNWAAGSSRPRYFQIRGVGDLEQYQGAPNPSVGFLIDDIDLSGIGMAATLFDIEQIEVLRGPQGTRYGANALAGLINVRSRAPTRDFDLMTQATLAQDSTWSAGGVIGGALPGTDSGAFRLALQRFVNDGFRHNAFLDRNDTNGRDELSARARARFEPGEAWRIDVTALQIDLDNGYDAFSIDNSRVTQSDDPGHDSQRTRGAALNVDYHGGPIEVLSTTAYADSDIEYSFDGDWGNDAFWGVPYRFTSRTLRDRRTLTQDLRFMSAPLAAGHPFAWLAGAYYRRLEESNDQLDAGVYLTDFSETALQSAFSAWSYAFYGQADWRVRPPFDLSLGLRLEHRDARYDDSNGEHYRPADDMVGGHVTASYALSERQHWYASLTRGYKAGGFNIGAGITPDRRQYDPEYLWNLETGLKSSWRDGRVESTLALFYMERRNQQVDTSFQLDPVGDPLSYVFYLDNAAQGRNYGLEASARWNVSPQWLLEASLGLLDTYYIGYQTGGRDLDGREQAQAPAYQYSTSATWHHPRGWMARVDVMGRDAFYYSASHDERARVSTLVNLRAGYETGRWAVHVWGLNVLDENYSQLGFFFGNEPPDFANKRYTQAGDPAQWGVSAEWHF